MAIKKKKAKKVPVFSARRQSLPDPVRAGTSAEGFIDRIKAYFTPGKTATT